ncbi:unnamed protein product [Darwinula stevensoni]|uniref:Uncharacterized protein n=1 Tax=Darwinula stevensoni TaxID=69355 RepID=A0A7R9A369_9CRUS|nr:unnamed protein product [Darwinula stevensoni]CAG0887193.1 unnamed protein product [Darwinula stevensoni]
MAARPKSYSTRTKVGTSPSTSSASLASSSQSMTKAPQKQATKAAGNVDHGGAPRKLSQFMQVPTSSKGLLPSPWYYPFQNGKYAQGVLQRKDFSSKSPELDWVPKEEFEKLRKSKEEDILQLQASLEKRMKETEELRRNLRTVTENYYKLQKDVNRRLTEHEKRMKEEFQAKSEELTTKNAYQNGQLRAKTREAERMLVDAKRAHEETTKALKDHHGRELEHLRKRLTDVSNSWRKGEESWLVQRGEMEKKLRTLMAEKERLKTTLTSTRSRLEAVSVDLARFQGKRHQERAQLERHLTDKQEETRLQMSSLESRSKTLEFQMAMAKEELESLLNLPKSAEEGFCRCQVKIGQSDRLTVGRCRVKRERARDALEAWHGSREAKMFGFFRRNVNKESEKKEKGKGAGSNAGKQSTLDKECGKSPQGRRSKSARESQDVLQESNSIQKKESEVPTVTVQTDLPGPLNEIKSIPSDVLTQLVAVDLPTKQEEKDEKDVKPDSNLPVQSCAPMDAPREERKKDDTRKLREEKVESEKKFNEEIKKLKKTLELKEGEVQERTHHTAALSRELEKARKEMEDLKTQLKRKGEHEGKCGSEDAARLKSLEIETHQLQEALKRKQEELEKSENAKEELEKRVKELEESLKSTQDQLEELKKEKEVLDGDREAELSFIQEALEEALSERAEIQARFESVRTMTSTREQQMMDDFEWKLREIERGYKQKILEKEQEIKEKLKTMRQVVEQDLSKEKQDAWELKRCAEEQMAQVLHLKSYEPELRQLQGLVHEQQRALRVASHTVEKLKVNERPMLEEIKRLRTLHDPSRIRKQEEEAFQARLVQTKNELNAEIAELNRTIMEKESKWSKELQTIRATSDRDIWELRRKLQRLDEAHEEEVEKIREEHDKEKERLRVELFDSCDDDMRGNPEFPPTVMLEDEGRSKSIEEKCQRQRSQLAAANDKIQKLLQERQRIVAEKKEELDRYQASLMEKQKELESIRMAAQSRGISWETLRDFANQVWLFGAAEALMAIKDRSPSWIPPGYYPSLPTDQVDPDR